MVSYNGASTLLSSQQHCFCHKQTITGVDASAVLSDALAKPDTFACCKLEDLDQVARYNRLVLKLRQEMQRGSVICLQEVTLLPAQLPSHWSAAGISELDWKADCRIRAAWVHVREPRLW